MKKTKSDDADTPFVNLLAHSVRIRRAIEDRDGEHPRAGEYARSIGDYKVQWSGASPEQKKTAIKVASEIHDMDHETVNAAVAALEE
jgi:hypothetical protein